jgi:hypothetical protein
VAAVVLALLAVAGSAAPPPDESPADITKGEIQDLVKSLASDAMQGREAGTPGCDEAADLIASEFARMGLAPAGDDASFFQRFTIPKGMKVLPATSLSGTDATGKTVAFDLDGEFVPADGSAKGDVTAEAVFAGYGIRADDLSYDDYDGIDAKGKVVVVLRHAPAWEDRKSPFAAPDAQRRYAALQAKREAAAGAGAAALVIVNDPASSSTRDKDDLRPPGGGAVGAIPVVQVAWRAKTRLLDLLGTGLVRRQQQIDAKVRPMSEALAGVRIRVNCALEPEVRNVRNVVGLLAPAAPAGTPGAAGAAAPRVETIVVGAHYDHIGVGDFGSLGGGPGKVHHGADDNASGTAAVVEIAEWLAARRVTRRGGLGST